MVVRMADSKRILVEQNGPVTWLILNRPEKLNAMDADLLTEFSHTLAELKDDDACRVVVIRGAGTSFSTGYDLATTPTPHGDAYGPGPSSVDDLHRLTANMDRYLAIWDFPKPVIAAVHGYCLAGASQLCVFCDLTIVADDAQIGVPSLPLGAGLIGPLWATLIGPKRAKQIFFQSGSKISGAQAADWGWANFSVPADDLFEEVQKLGERISRIPAELLDIEKRAINRASEVASIRAVGAIGADADAIAHQTRSVRDLANLVREKGPRAAIAEFESRA